MTYAAAVKAARRLARQTDERYFVIRDTPDDYMNATIYVVLEDRDFYCEYQWVRDEHIVYCSEEDELVYA